MTRRIMAVLLAGSLLLTGSLLLADARVLAGLLPPGAALAEGVSCSAHTPLPEWDEAKLENIRLAAEAIDGARVASGEFFSFNETVGPRQRRRGFKKAENGRGAVVTGGGVAQAASTLYMALLQLEDDVDIDPVRTYGSRFVDDYVDDEDLAIITDYDADIDLAFTNLGDDMTIDMWLEDDTLWCVLTTGGDGMRPSSGGGVGLLDFLGGDRSGEEDLENTGDDPDDDDDEDGDEAAGVAPVIYGTPWSPSDDAGRALMADSALDCGGDGDVIHNVELAAACVDDTVLERGDTFSFNDVVGPRTAHYGYRRATNGRGARVMGGGVAQVASAIWLAVKELDDITVVEKSTYGNNYNQHYVDRSADAILTDYSSGRDFCFRYTGRESITLSVYVTDGWLYCEVYGE